MLNGALVVKNRSSTSVVCDAGPIIHLDELEALHLLRDFNKVIIPEGVFKEVLKHRPVAIEGSEINWTKIQSSYQAIAVAGNNISYQ
jgi:predicted nucleic acid-binding protein